MIVPIRAVKRNIAAPVDQRVELSLRIGRLTSWTCSDPLFSSSRG
jgi:hypothetical protein